MKIFFKKEKYAQPQYWGQKARTCAKNDRTFAAAKRVCRSRVGGDRPTARPFFAHTHAKKSPRHPIMVTPFPFLG